ncbi:MAG TPA: hypothetical protein VFX48_03405, partial [Saprospiraceae bacterium]|nr:hypothetical protein [Saprospiraceae bacterium]
IGLKKQDRFIFNIHEVEKNLSEKEIRKYLLKLPEDHPEDSFPGDEFEASITKVLRKKPAELSEDFYKKAFGPETSITNESELRQNLRENLQRYFDQECSKLLDLELVRKIVHDSGMRFPDAFLTKWLQASYTEWADKTGHDLEHELLHFKEGLAWKLLREHIVETRQLNLKYEELTHAVIEEMKTQYPGIQLPDESWQELARRTLQDKEKSMHYFIEAQNRKALEWIRSQIQVEEAEVSLDEFRDKVKQINAHNH